MKKKKLLIFRFENVLINIQPGQYYIQKNLWKLLKELKKEGYKLVLITSLGFEGFIKAVTSMNDVSEVIHTHFDKLISSHQPDRQLDELLRFAKNNKIELDEIVYFGNYYTDFKAAQEAKIDFIGVINELPENNLLATTLSPDKKIHPILLDEFMQNYLELTTTV
jgi:phosphoglycolate phosphatase-like HAD superfamily hydrolase